MISRRRFVEGAVGAIALVSTPSLAQAGADWSEDIRILRRAYETLHPGLYRYATAEATAARLARLESSFAGGLTLREAYLQLSEFLSTVQCGHSYANFYNQPKPVSAALFEGTTRLPFLFRWFGDRMVAISGMPGGGPVTRGSEVLKINGISAQKMLRHLLPLARADGGNDFKRRALLSATGDDSYETFDIFQGLMFPPKDGAFTLKIRTRPGADVKAVSVPAIGLSARRAMSKAASADKNAPAWDFAWAQERTGLLTMPGWALYNSTWNWRAFLDGVFAELADRKATGLVVDLRGNEGGLDCGHEIIARLIDKDLSVESYERRVRYRKVPADLNPYLDTWDDSFRDWGDKVTPLDDRFFLQKSTSAESITAKGPRFTGKVAVLTDSQNSSATFQFSRLVQDNALATLIGEPTGGNKRGINGGAFFFMRLPKSGIEVDIPLIGYFPKAPQPDEGLTPDVFSAPTIDDTREGRDATLETALKFASA
jgi:hypothetical protein